MKKIIAFSDTHGNIKDLQKIEHLFKEVDFIFFLGDGYDDVKPYIELYGDKIVCVKGNNDGFARLDGEKIVEVDGIKLFLTHGHRYRVEQTLLNLAFEAASKGCSAAIYGHTHNSDISEFDDIKLINGGAFYQPKKGVSSYAYIIIHGKKVLPKIVEIL